MANRNYKELSDLVGKPSKGETKFSLGGPFADKIFDKTKWEATAYAVCAHINICWLIPKAGK